LRLTSVRNRLFLVVAGVALLASLAIGVGYIATESARRDVQDDGAAVVNLSSLTLRLAETIRDEEAGIDDYLLSRDAAALARYRAAAESEVRLSEEIRLNATELTDFAAAVASLASESQAWRASFAEPAVEAVERGSAVELAAAAAGVAHDQEPAKDEVDNLLSRLAAEQASIRQRDMDVTATRALASGVGLALMLGAAFASLVLVRRWVTSPLARLLATASAVETGLDVPFDAGREDEIGQLGRALERMRVTLRGDVEHSSVLNRFTEVTTFASDDAAVAAANLEALSLLVGPDAAVVHVLNRSKDRAVPEATMGAAVAEVLPLNALSRCPGVVRGGIYVTSDLSQPLSVHCPIYPAEGGTLACIALAHGETVGAIHLHWDLPGAFGLEQRSGVSRVAEHAALAIANRRLLAALQGMASTDARTGLANTRTFDQTLEDALASRAGDEELAILMLDLDHFKDFNDRYGHPSGDEALRAFADILRSCLRDGDVAARYGGEEFAVLLPGVDPATAAAIAERIRSRTESTLISLAPGITDRISVSIGIAVAPSQALDRITLLRRADEALYRAKQTGRNRVEMSEPWTVSQPQSRRMSANQHSRRRARLA
jgi:diguanylate cyclase (GGDEF)-like protein